MRTATPTNGHKRKTKTVRVAAYCRQSVDRSSTQEFGSIEAQRQAIEAYVVSQRALGWELIPERYEDLGFSGKDTKRPAFERLMSDVAAGKVDVIAVYKLDRLSRSLRDFTGIMAQLDEHSVAFVSITQAFDTSSSIGRLTLNLLGSFAEFERVQISERVRDKVLASRREGYYTTGPPPFGYERVDRALVIVDAEAEQVREIFSLYLKLASTQQVAAELDRRGWTTRTGARWDKKTVGRVLSNVVVSGKVEYEGEVFDGRHDAIIDTETFDAVQAQLEKNRRRPRWRGGGTGRNKWGMLLKGLLYCAQCGRAMTHTYSARGRKRYHYYICQRLNLCVPDACRRARLPARETEAFVVDKIREIGKDPSVVAKAVTAAQHQARKALPKLRSEARRLADEIRKLRGERRNLLDAIAGAGNGASAIGERLGEVDQQLAKVESRRQEVQAEQVAIETETVREEDVAKALAQFDGVWDQLVAEEKARVLNLLIERIDYDAEAGMVDITYRPGGIRALAEGAA